MIQIQTLKAIVPVPGWEAGRDSSYIVSVNQW